MDERVPVAAAAGAALFMLALGLVVLTVSRRAADGRLPLNPVAGIRTRDTMRSQGAWQSGHAAARGLSDAAGAVFALTGVVASALRQPASWAGVLLGGTTVATVLLLLAARRAGQAARSTG